MTLTPAQRRRLKSLAHHLEPLVQVGQKGITESLIGAVDEVLTNHELVKVRFMDFKDEKHALSDQIVERTGAGLVGIIGVAVLGIGVVLMLLQAKVAPDFFRGKVLAKADATEDTSMLEVFDDGLSG